MSILPHRLTGILLVPLLLLAPPAALADRLRAIEAAGLLRVCIWPDYHGISFRNPKNGELSGIDIDNARELGRELKAEVQFVDSSFATLVGDVLADRCDIAMFAIGRTPARVERLRFTTPYLASDIYAITSRANRRIQTWADIDRPGTVVVVARGTLHETVMRERLKAADLRIVDTPHAREQEVLAGRADVFMTDYPYTRRLLGSSDWARLVEPPAAFHVTPYAWVMAPGDDLFHAWVEEFIGRIKGDGRLLASARRHGLAPIVAR